MQEITLNSGWKARKAVQEHIDAVIERNAKASQALVTTSEAAARHLKIIIVVGVTAGFVLSILLGLLLTRSITRPLADCLDFAGAVAKGDLGRELGVRRGDETGVLADSLRRMVETLRQTIEEARRKGQEAEQEALAAQQAKTEAEQAKQAALDARRDGMSWARPNHRDSKASRPMPGWASQAARRRDTAQRRFTAVGRACSSSTSSSRRRASQASPASPASRAAR